jgi:hypothetical protein
MPDDAQFPYNGKTTFGQGPHFEEIETAVPEISVIEIRGQLHRIPTVLRPGPVRTSWRYDPKDYELDASHRGIRWKEPRLP